MLKGWLSILVAVVLAAGAFAASYTAIRIKEEEVTRGWDLVEVLVARDAIPQGAVLSTDLIDVDVMPRRFFHETAIMTPRYRGEALNKEVLVPIEKGQPIQWYQLRGLREQDRLASQVRQGFRAVTINVSEASSVAHWVTPNDSIDVIGSFRDPAKRELTTITLLQNISVLATGRESSTIGGSQDSREEYTSVTLQMLPQEAEILVLAQELGNLHLTLRNREDQGVLEERTRTTIETLITGTQLEELEKRRRHTIQIIRGLQKQAGE